MSKAVIITSGVFGALFALLSLYIAFLLFKCGDVKKSVIVMFVILTLFLLISSVYTIIKPDDALSKPSFTPARTNSEGAKLADAITKALSLNTNPDKLDIIKNAKKDQKLPVETAVNGILKADNTGFNVKYDDILEYIRRGQLTYDKTTSKFVWTDKKIVPSWLIILAGIILLILLLSLLIISLYIIIKMFKCDNISKILAVIYLICLLINYGLRSYALK